MPQPKCVKSLKDSCLLNICKNMEKVWCKDYDVNFSELPRLLYVIGPFEDLTSSHLQELFSTLNKLKLLRRKHFPLLMTSHLKDLNLSVCKSVGGCDGILTSAARRCKYIRKLNIGGCKSISPGVLKSALCQLPMLTSLDVSDTKCNDSVVAVIGATCANLLDLNMRSCPATDKSAHFLCPLPSKVTECRNVKGPNTGCHKIVCLVIDFTKISSDGAKHLLDNLRHLQYLGYADLFDVLLMECNCEHVLTKNKNSETISKRTLRTISLGHLNGVPDEEIVQVISFTKFACPFLTEFHFHEGATNQTLFLLKDFPHLSVLEIGGSHKQISFQYGMVPLLQSIGEQIKSLCLFEFDNIDTSMIGILCKNIKKLKISALGMKGTTKYQTSYLPQEQTNSEQKIFKCLEKFSFIHVNDYHTFSEMSLLQIMENASHLQELHLHFTSCFSDNLFENLWQHNSLVHLKQLHLENCDNVTCCSIDNLVYSGNSLEFLMLHNCVNISLRDFERYKKYAKTNNMNFHVLWE